MSPSRGKLGDDIGFNSCSCKPGFLWKLGKGEGYSTPFFYLKKLNVIYCVCAFTHAVVCIWKSKDLLSPAGSWEWNLGLQGN